MIIQKYHYFGEFGGLIFVVLGGLENFFNLYPSVKLEICTYRNYGILLEHLFPKNVRATTIKWNFKDNLRIGYEYADRDFINNLHKKGYLKNVIVLFKQFSNDKMAVKCFNNLCFNVFDKDDAIYFRLKKPITYGKKSSRPKYISIFPRFRKLDSKRNISKKDWEYILKILKSYYKNYKIVVHGSNNEFLKLNIDDAIYPKNILEQIYYLNNSRVCVSPNSGFAHFAVYCKCPLLVIGMGYWEYEDINPFKVPIKITDVKHVRNSNVLRNFLDKVENTKDNSEIRKSFYDFLWIHYRQSKRIVGTFLKYYIPKAYYLLRGPDSFDSYSAKLKKQIFDGIQGRE